MKVYVVKVSSGEYDTYYEQIGGVFDSREKAEEFAIKVNKENGLYLDDTIKKLIDDFDERYQTDHQKEYDELDNLYDNTEEYDKADELEEKLESGKASEYHKYEPKYSEEDYQIAINTRNEDNYPCEIQEFNMNNEEED